MRVLLVVPPSYGLAPDSIPSFHLGVGYLAAAMRQEGHAVHIYDANVPIEPGRRRLTITSDLLKNIEIAAQDPTQPVWEEAERVLREQAPQVVGISAKVLDLRLGLFVARLAKRVVPECKVVVGGPAATTCSEMVLAEEAVDFVVRGEGELTFAELLKALAADDGRDFQYIQGLSFRNRSDIVHTPQRALIEDLDHLPLPARDLLLYADRQPLKHRRALMGDMVTSRGCPFGCTFCANRAVWGTRRVRERSPAGIVDEMLVLKNTYGAQRLILWDDQLPMNRRRAVELCELLISRGSPVKFITYAHANTLTLELVLLLKAAGCCELQLGVESGSDRVLKLINKGTNVAKVKEAARVLRQGGMRWHAFFMIGFPSETEAEMRETLRILYELDPDSALLSIVTPYPGTELFDHAIRSGRLRENEWLHADTCRLESALVDTMSPEAFSRLASELSRKFTEFNENRAMRDASPLKRAAHYAALRVYRASKKVLGEERAIRLKSYLRG